MSELASTTMTPATAPATSASPDLGRPGHRLQAARQALGWSPEQVAEQLKWAPRQVLALESDDYQALHGMATVRGFVRAYAKLLKLDPAPLLTQLEPGSAAQVLPVRHDLAAPFSEVRLPSMHQRGLSGAHWAIGGAIALVLAVLLARQMGWLKPLPPDLFNRFTQSASASMAGGANGDTGSAAGSAAVDASASAAAVSGAVQGVPATSVTDPAAGQTAANISTPMPTTPPTTPPTTAPTATPMSAPTTTQAAPPTVTPTGAATGVTAAPGATTVPGVTNANNALVLKFNQDCWVEVRRVNGNVLLSRLIKAGETETVPMTDPVQLVIGNVAGVEASLRGAPLVLKNGPGNTARLTVK